MTPDDEIREADRLHRIGYPLDIDQAQQDGAQESGILFHEECGYLWMLHDNTVAGRPLPFGCPSETDALAAFGDRYR